MAISAWLIPSSSSGPGDPDPPDEVFAKTTPMLLPELFARWYGPIPPIKDGAGRWGGRTASARPAPSPPWVGRYARDADQRRRAASFGYIAATSAAPWRR